MPTLFDNFKRTDGLPASHQESSFAFLNRISTPWWTTVREEVEAWFGAYTRDADTPKAADLRARFRSTDGRQHLGAWWELYVYRLLCSLHSTRCALIEPERPGKATRPDFCIADETGAAELWVEAVTTFSGIVEEGRHGAREAFVLDAINEVTSPDFRVWIKTFRVGATQPRKREIQLPLREWLRVLDRDEVLRQMENGESRPRTKIATRGWELVLEAVPKGRPGTTTRDRLIGIGPMSSGYVNDEDEVRKAIVRKGRHYDGLAAPFAIAVMPSSPFFDNDDAVGALYGSEAVRFDPDQPEDVELIRQPNGAWLKSRRDVSAVLFGPGIFPWTVGTTWPVIWVNPHATRPLGSMLPLLPRMEATETGLVQTNEPAEPPARLLGLDPSWPGLQRPFDD